MIDLLNRRYVCFFFNVGEGQHGWDADAGAWFKKHKQKHVYSGIFTHEGKRLVNLPNTGDKDVYFKHLRKTLDANEAQDIYTEEELKIVDAAGAEDPDAKAILAAARVYEELGKYDEAVEQYAKTNRAKALLAQARIARYRENWKDAQALLEELSKRKGAKGAMKAKIAMEVGYALLADKKYDEARKVLVEAAKAHPKCGVIGELHYYAGIASWKLDRKEWAHFHWYHIIEKLPEDRHYQRAFISVAINAIPFPFAELPDERRGGMVTHDSANKARAKAKADYDRLKDEFAADDYWEPKDKPADPETPEPKKPEPAPDTDKEEEF